MFATTLTAALACTQSFSQTSLACTQSFPQTSLACTQVSQTSFTRTQVACTQVAQTSRARTSTQKLNYAYFYTFTGIKFRHSTANRL
jgi:hypothetical protein